MLIWIALIYVLLVLVFRVVCAVVKRMRLIASLKHICVEKGWQYRQNRAPLASFFAFSSVPDIEIEAHDTLYCIRLFTCINRHWFLHFPKENVVLYTKRYMRLYSRGRGPKIAATVEERVSIKKMRLLPQIKLPETSKAVERILLFNPAPKEISNVNASRTAAEIRGNGDELFGQRICNFKWFAHFIMTREENGERHERF